MTSKLIQALSLGAAVALTACASSERTTYDPFEYYDYYDAGFFDTGLQDDWFFDYYELQDTHQHTWSDDLDYWD